MKWIVSGRKIARTKGMRLRAAVACELEESFKKIAWILITSYIKKVHRYNIEIVTLHIARLIVGFIPLERNKGLKKRKKKSPFSRRTIEEEEVVEPMGVVHGAILHGGKSAVEPGMIYIARRRMVKISWPSLNGVK